MNDQLLSLQRIFTDRLFRIPDYQRGYAWEIKEVKEFWNDLNGLANNKNHYVGVLTLEPVAEAEYRKWIDDIWLIDSKSYRPYYVVDGQQRLTTSIILIVSLLELMHEKKIEKLNYSDKKQISNRFIKEYKDENYSCSYLFSYDIENPSYKYLTRCIYEGKTMASDFQETVYTANLDAAKKFFKNQLEKMSIKELECVFKKISQHFLFNTYEISSDIDVYVTFETMNNRGKPLSYLELLKNRLIYISTLFNQNEDIKKRLRRDINDCWKTIYHLLGVNKERKLQDDEFLNAHFILYFSKMLKASDGNRGYYHPYMMYKYLLEEYFLPQSVNTEKLAITQVFDYIKSLQTGIVCWNNMNNPEFSNFGEDTKEYLKKIYYLCKNPYGLYGYSFNLQKVKILLMVCLENIDKEIILLKLLKSLEKYLFYLKFIPAECFSIEFNPVIDFVEMIPKLKSGDLSLNGLREKINKVCEELAYSDETNNKIIKYYNRHGFYESEFLRYFLCEYEVSLMKMSKNLSEKLNRDLLYTETRDSIEHIYPQNARSKYWRDLFAEYTQKQRVSLRCSLGNFVALSQPKNGKLGNKSFLEKKGDKQNSVGYMYGTYAEIELSNYEKWGAEEILERGIHLTNFLQNRWGIRIGKSKKDIIEFLGLDFLK